MQAAPVKRLGSYLVDAGLVTSAQVDVALNDQNFMADMRIGDILVTRGWIKQQTLDYLIEKVVEPEQRQARQEDFADAMVVRHPPQGKGRPPEPVTEIPDFGDTTLGDYVEAEPQETIAQARSLDGTRVLDILKPRKRYTVAQETPTNPGNPNDRKALSSIKDDDEMNWVG